MNLDATLQKNQTAIALKGGMLTLTTIQIFVSDLNQISHELDEKIKQAPNFFLYAPIVLDLQPLGNNGIDFLALIPILKSKKLMPVGIRSQDTALRETAIHTGLAIFPETKESVTAKSDPTRSETSKPVTPSTQSPTKVITHPIRSGQQIYAQGGDLIVLSAVSHGAELLADGHIHVHGALRGRALAGVMGDNNAMIYCKSLEAELVSIAGQYRVSEDLKKHTWKKTVMIQLQESKLEISEI